MRKRGPRRIMMISTHGYVAATPELGKPDTGGQVVYILELARCLGRLGFHIDIFTRQFENQPASEEVADRVRVIRIPCGGNEFIPKEYLCESIPEWVINTLEFVRKGRLKCEFINSHYWDAGLAGLDLARKLHVRHLHTPHSIGSWKKANMPAGQGDEAEKRWNFDRRIRDEKVIYDESDGVIATTPQQRQLLVGGDYDVPLSKIHVVPPGYDDSRFFPVSISTRQTLKQELKLKGRIVLALGRLARNKGYDLLIRAMRIVVDRAPDVKLLLAIGSTTLNEDEAGQLESLRGIAQELGIADNVLFRDYIPDDLLADYYRAGDVFALSSRYEPFGMTAVEAMACGTPTVVTTEGGLWEEINWGADAIYANPNDYEAFGHAICQILQYPRIADRLAKYGSQRARARFTWTGIAQQILEVFDGVNDQAIDRVNDLAAPVLTNANLVKGVGI
jgi:mannosylfructose-phosphate synthase